MDANLKNKKVIPLLSAILLAAVIFACAACAQSPSEEQNNINEETEQQETIEITLPGSLFEFANTDLQDNKEAFEEYCTDVREDGDSLVLEVTEEQREALIEMNQKNIDDILDQVAEENSEYSCELSSDYSKVVYKYDENIDGILQAKILVSLTSIYVMNGIIETNNSDWSVDASIVNCHTGKIVVQGIFPGASLTFGEAEWKASYE